MVSVPEVRNSKEEGVSCATLPPRSMQVSTGDTPFFWTENRDLYWKPWITTCHNQSSAVQPEVELFSSQQTPNRSGTRDFYISRTDTSGSKISRTPEHDFQVTRSNTGYETLDSVLIDHRRHEPLRSVTNRFWDFSLGCHEYLSIKGKILPSLKSMWVLSLISMKSGFHPKPHISAHSLQYTSISKMKTCQRSGYILTLWDCYQIYVKKAPVFLHWYHEASSQW